MTPVIHDCPERLTAMRRRVIPLHGIAHAIGPGAAELRELVTDAGGEILSAPYARYHSFTDEDSDIEVGFEVAAPIVAKGVEMGSLSAGREAVATHRGAYKDIPRTFAMLEEWVLQNAERREPPREVYLSNPDKTPMADRETLIVYPIL